MNKLLSVVFLVGFAIVVGAAMMAFDTFMTDERKSVVRAEINDQLDVSSASYEDRRDSGCRRRCGFFGSMSNLITGLRDGVFAGLPFQPEEVFPPAPEGWNVAPYSLAAVEGIVGAPLERSMIVASTNDGRMARFHDFATQDGSGAARIYSYDDKHIAMAIKISRDGMRGGNRGPRPRPAEPTEIVVNGLTLQMHAAIHIDQIKDTRTPVDYGYYSINLDRQVTIELLTRAEAEEIAQLLSGFDLDPVVANLPRLPKGYVPKGTSAQLAVQIN